VFEIEFLSRRNFRKRRRREPKPRGTTRDDKSFFFIRFFVFFVVSNRRRRDVGDRVDEVVFQEIRIEDRFKFETRRNGGEMDFVGAGHRWNAYAPDLLVAVFVLVQLSAALACWLCCARRKSRRDAAAAVRRPPPPICWDENRYG